MKNEAQKVTGGCLCGAVRFVAEVFLHQAYYCHCRDCQKNTGQPASIGVPVKVDSLRFTKEEPKYYISSPWGQRGFCPHCGSGLVWRPRDASQEWLTNLNAASLDNPDDVRPVMHIYADRQLSWYRLDDDLPRANAAEMDEILEIWRTERLGKADQP